MTDIIIRKSLGRTAGANTDRVISFCPLPEDCVLKSVEGRFITNWGAFHDFSDMFRYGVAAFVIPVEDPDTNVALDTIWDQRVPKDADWAEDGLDLDTGSGNTAPEFEPGEPSVFALINEQAGLREIFRYRKTVTMADMGVSPILDTTAKFFPQDKQKVNINKSYRGMQHSLIMFGVSNPENVDVSATLPLMPTEVEWNMMKFIDHVVEGSFIALSGLGDEEAVSVTLPYETAMLFLAALIEDDTRQEAGGYIVQVASLSCQMNATYTVGVPGNFKMKAITSEG